MAGKPEYDKEVSTKIVLAGLQKLGIHGVANGRNDLVLEDEQGIRKFSGSAYRETLDRGFHHGTLLLSADLNRLADYLNPDLKKLQAKGITSVKSRVINLNTVKADIEHQQVCEAIMQAYCEHYQQQVEPELISPQSFLICRDLSKNSLSKAVGIGTSDKRHLLLTTWMNDLAGVASRCILKLSAARLCKPRFSATCWTLIRWSNWRCV